MCVCERERKRKRKREGEGRWKEWKDTERERENLRMLYCLQVLPHTIITECKNGKRYSRKVFDQGNNIYGKLIITKEHQVFQLSS